MIALLADAHVANHRRWGGPVVGGLNVRARECVDTLCAMAAQAWSHADCDALVVLGDLFDSPRPSPPLVRATIDALLPPAVTPGTHHLGDRRVIIVLGNHDRQTQHDLDHACAAAALHPQVVVVAKPTLIKLYGVDLMCVPYQAGLAFDWLTAGLAELADGMRNQIVPPLTTRRVVATHLGIWDDQTESFLREAHDAVGVGVVKWLMDMHHISALFAGNWHKARSWAKSDRLIVIPGTACPHNFSDQPELGKLVFYMPGANMMQRPSPMCTPLFLTVDAVELAEFDESMVHGARGLYVRARVQRGEVAAALAHRARLEAFTGAGRVVVSIEVVDGLARAELARASRRAVEDFRPEDHMDLAAVAEPGTAAGVVERLRAYRAGAG